jgi:hypothetical protein
MKKTILLGLMLFAICSQAKADSCDANINQTYEEYKLVCAETPEDLNRTVNAVRLTKNSWRILGSVIIFKKDSFNFTYCQTLYRNY